MKKRGLIEDLSDFLITMAIVVVTIVLMNFVIQEKFSKVKGDVELYGDITNSAEYLAFLNTPIEINGDILKVSDLFVLLCYETSKGESNKSDYGFEIMKKTKEFFDVEIFCSKEKDPSIVGLENYFTLPSLGGDIKVIIVNVKDLEIMSDEDYNNLLNLGRKDLGYRIEVYR